MAYPVNIDFPLDQDLMDTLLRVWRGLLSSALQFLWLRIKKKREKKHGLSHQFEVWAC